MPGLLQIGEIDRGRQLRRHLARDAPHHGQMLAQALLAVSGAG
jgi:hypothetical protein